MSERFDTAKHADLIYDIGMHRGEDTEFYLRKGFRVVAVEADPALASAARERFGAFLGDERLVIVEGAIVEAGSGASVTFYKNDAHSPWGTVRPQWVERNLGLGAGSTPIEVRAVSIVEVLRRYGIPRYMKIDIEGCDLICVEALRAFAGRPDYLSLESDKTSLAAIRREIELLVELGYDAFQAVEQSAIAQQVPPRNAREGSYVDHRFALGSSGLFGLELEGPWMSAEDVVARYRRIAVGYKLLGDDGILNRREFPGARIVRGAVRRALALFSGGAVPGWYDTHARHASIVDGSEPPG